MAAHSQYPQGGHRREHRRVHQSEFEAGGILRQRLADQSYGLPVGEGLDETVEDVASATVKRERGTDVEHDEDLERIAVGLHHVHLPKLADAGVLDYDPASNHVESFRGLRR